MLAVALIALDGTIPHVNGDRTLRAKDSRRRDEEARLHPLIGGGKRKRIVAAWPRMTKRLQPSIQGYSTDPGDGNAADRRTERSVKVLPTPRPFARFQFWNMMNNRDYNAPLMCVRTRRSRFRVDSTRSA